MTRIADRRVGEALATLASKSQPAAAGVASALACASGAALVELTAGLAADRIAAEGSGARGGNEAHLRALVGESGQLRRRLLAAADQDAEAYARVLAARNPAERARALDRSSEPPLAIAECAADVAEAAAETAQAGTWAFRADAVVAGGLAAAAAVACAELVATNLAATPADARIDRSRAAAERAARARDAAASPASS
jgi:formiminotetrahydrofolate cyclodeaminase